MKNRGMNVMVVAALAVCLGAAWAGAATFYVDLNYIGTETGSDTQPFDTIREAVAAANASAGADTIKIAAGTYDNTGEDWSGSGQYEMTDVDGSLTVEGGYGGVGDWASRNPRSTIIDLSGAGTRAFYNNDMGHLILDGITGVNGDGSTSTGQGAGQGGFLYMYDTGYLQRDVMVTNCLFTNNTAVTGGAVFINKPRSMVIADCDFYGNASTGTTVDGDGGGAIAIGAHPDASVDRVERCTFGNNTAASRGGAIGLYGTGLIYIRDCTLTNNTATGNGAAIGSMLANNDSMYAKVYRCVITDNTGSAIHKELDARYYLENCLVADNTGDGLLGERWSRSDGIYSFNVVHSTIANNGGAGIKITTPDTWTLSEVVVSNSIVAFNDGVGISLDRINTGSDIILEYNDVYGNGGGNYGEEASAGTGSISADPRFVSAATGDYHCNGGPCLDAGTDLGITVDLEGTARVGVDLGCYEIVPPPKGCIIMVR